MFAMTVKEWFKTMLAGAAIGVGSSIPGVSGGTIAVIFKVYEKLLWAISNIFKQFKRAVIYLLPILVGFVLAMIPTLYLMYKALNGFLFGVVALFAGFIIGSIPGITDEVKGQEIKKGHIIALAITFVVAVGLGVGSVLLQADVSSQMVNPQWWMYLLLIPIGFVASIALVVPGLSGSMLLLLLGFYKPLVTTTVVTAKNCLHGDWSGFGQQVGILACFAVGVIVGFYIISRIMHYLLSEHRVITFYAIIGFVVGSVISLFFNNDIYTYYYAWTPSKYAYELPIGIVLLFGGCIASYMLVRYTRKHKEEQVEEENKNDVTE